MLCKITTANCSFERNFQFGNIRVRIPPLCKLNPLYKEIVHLRFLCISYLAEECRSRRHINLLLLH
ncbi:Mo-dependent nitrogenase C-terminal domain-containing protein [Gloeocapsa sp. PCC 7428]|uniref:Mo-dependent nitrogenase C-terminal domain-containing protein n=1 Tax=Gloeocapsa sp. PCC 7428 TaxID=1173026 RepID=UPI00090074ED